MSSPPEGVIRVRGARQNNLKNINLDLPLGQLITITGLSGSGKSSLAFDTLYAEGQRRYIETFSPYARQFFDRMDKPKVDSIHGIPPAIAIEQKNSVKTTRSTVGTMTEIADHMKVAWSKLASLHCRQCGRPVEKTPPREVWRTIDSLMSERDQAEALVVFRLPLSDKLSMEESLDLLARQGFRRLLVNGAVVKLEDAHGLDKKIKELVVVQDRLVWPKGSRPRFIEACEQAYHFGKGRLEIFCPDDGAIHRFSAHLHCAECDIEYRDPVPALFSFNHPAGACPSCRGFGRTIAIGYHLAIPNQRLTLKQGAIKPWQSGHSADCQRDLMKYCRARGVPTDVPFQQLSKPWQDWVIHGEGDQPRQWYGVAGYFKWLESKSYKMHVRVLLSRYRVYTPCQTCHGKRFQPESLLYRARLEDGRSLTLADFYQLPVSGALTVLEEWRRRYGSGSKKDPLSLVLDETHARLFYLAEAGLGYLTLDRPTRTLSGGETERVNLTTCLGSRLVSALFVLDEPSVGLHPRDTERLVGILQRLRDSGNTVIVVEHEPSVMRASDRIVDLGPGHGETGGAITFDGPYDKILSSSESVTGRYLSGAEVIRSDKRRPVGSDLDNRGLVFHDHVLQSQLPSLKLFGANLHNLKNVSVNIPLHRFVCITGVSGSGKTTLVRDCLLPALQLRLAETPLHPTEPAEDSGSGEHSSDLRNGAEAVSGLEGAEHLECVALVDQSAVGKTPRSNPALYIGAFEYIRRLFATSKQARERSLKPTAFSFNSRFGQCARCRGAGFEKIEMQFLSDVYIRCPDCEGKRFNSQILEIQMDIGGKELNVADFLDLTADEAVALLNPSTAKNAINATARLKLLLDVGLGYLKLGQPINTLSGGESQRLKLVRHLAEQSGARPHSRHTLFLFDEPTTGLHFADVRILVDAFQKLVDDGHSVVVIEHNLELIKCADWIIDLGPEAGTAGGEVVATGPPESIAASDRSHTGKALRSVLMAPPPAPKRANRRRTRRAARD